MPFSRRNIRFTSLLIGIVVLVGMSVLAFVMLAQTPNPPPTLYTAAVGFPSVIIMHLLGMLKQQAETREAVHDLRSDLQHTTATVERVTNGELDRRMAEAAKAAIKEALPGIVDACRCKCKSEMREDQ